MRNFKRRLTQLTIGITVLAMTTVASPALARSRAGLKAQAVGGQGRVVTVNVANPAPTPLRITVMARVLTLRGVIPIFASVDLGAGQTGTVRMDIPTTALDVPPLGVVVDDGVPF